MQFTTVRSKEKDYDVCLKSEKLVHRNQEHEKNVSQLFGSGKTGSQPYRALQTLLQLFGERKKWILLLGDQKLQFTTVRSKQNYYDTYLKSEKLVHRNQENEINVFQLFGFGKNWLLAILSLTNTVAAISRKKNVDPCYLETKKCSSKLSGALKMIMTSI